MGGYAFLAQPYIPPSPVQTLGQLYALQNQRQEMQARGQEMSMRDLQIQAEQNQLRDREGVTRAYQESSQPGPDGGAPQFSQSGFEDKVRQYAPMQFPGVVKAGIDRQKSINELESQHMELLTKHLDYMASNLNTIQGAPQHQKQTVYGGVRDRLIKENVLQPGSPEDPGPLYPGDDAIQSLLSRTMSYKDQLDMKYKAMSIPLANQAVAAYSVPLEQRTPQQNAFLSGYEQNLQKAEIEPRVAGERARAVEVVPNPGNPGRVTYASAGDAIAKGMQAPSGAPTRAAIGAAESAASGQLGTALSAGQTVMSHADLYEKAIHAVNNGDVRMLNRIGNSLGIEMGNDAQTNLAQIRHALAVEVARHQTGGIPTEAEIKSNDELLNGDGSMKQQLGGVNTIRALTQSRNDALGSQVDAATKGKSTSKWWEKSPSDLKNPPSSSQQPQTKGPEAWMRKGEQNLTAQGLTSDEIARMRQTPQGRQQLESAGSVSPNSKMMRSIIASTKRQSGSIQVQLPDGRSGWIHNSQLQNFLQAHPGAKEVVGAN